MPPRNSRLAILVNIVAPYRKPIYEALARSMEVAIFHSGIEGNRKSWSDGADSVAGAQVKKSWGTTWTFNRGGKQVPDTRFLHFTPGVFLDLIRFRPDVVVTNEMGLRTLAALLYGTLFRVPVWVWWGGTMHTEKHIGAARKCVRWLVTNWARHWFTYGKSSTEYLRSLRVPVRRIVELQNCVDERLYQTPVPPAFQESPRPVILHVGQLNRRKGVASLLAAAGRLQSRGAEFSLVFVGGGPDETELKEETLRLGLRNVVFRPSQSPKEMPAIYRSADCLVFPTLEDVWGLVANEALWSGCPVLCSIHAGCAAEIVPLENRFDPLDPEDFDRALGRATRGEIKPADTGPLKTCGQVAAMILEAVKV